MCCVSATMPPSVPDDTVPQVTLWTVRMGDCHDEDLRAAYLALLAPAEQARLARFVFEQDRHAYLVSRALVRTVLGQLTGLPPQDLSFDAGPQGKPALASSGTPAGASWPFNLTHTRDLAILAVTQDRAVGVDVESMDRPAPIDVGLRQFAPLESRALADLAGSPDAQAAHFWSLWTLKESLIKATGQGLTTPLNRFGFALTPDTVSLQCHPHTPEGDSTWWLAQWQPSERHMAALCVETLRSDGAAPLVQEVYTVPLRQQRPLALHISRSSGAI